MNFITTIGYHDAYFEVEIVVHQNSKTKKEAEKIGNENDLYKAMFYDDKIMVGKGEKIFTIHKSDKDLYQFRICFLTEEEIQNKGNIVSFEDYKNISWDEALQYFCKEYKEFSLPFSLESYYYTVYENEVVFS